MENNNKIYKLIPIILTAILCGCSWMSSADLPKLSTPKNFNSQGNNINLESLPYLAWWKQFNDSSLTNLIESGLKNNLDINIALSNLEQARGQLTQVKLSWLPVVNLYGGYSSNPAFGDIGTFYGIWPQYTLNIINVLQQQKRANYNVQLREAMLDGVRLTLIGQIATSYFSLLSQKRQLLLLQQLELNLQEILNLEQKEIEIGIRDNLDLEVLRAELDLVQAQIEIVQHNLVLSNNALSYLLNNNPGVIKSSDNFITLDFSKFKPNSLPSYVLENRPDLKIAEYELQISHSSVGVAYSNLFPAVQLDKFLGYGSLNDTYATPNHNVSLQDMYLNWGINPTTFGEIEAGKGAYQAQVYSYIQTVRKILRDVDNGLSANNRYNANYIKTNQALEKLQNKYNLQKGLYDTGILAYPQLLRSKVDVINMELTENQAKLNQALALVNLYQELAGGYKSK